MLTLWGSKRRFCDSVNRRDFLQVGASGLGLSLADVLRLRARLALSSPRAVIMVCLAGGPSHLDMYDLKPDAPADYRGEFKPIKTNVPGFDICEHMPMQAQHRRQAGPGAHRAVRRADAARIGRGLHRLPQGVAASVVWLGHQPVSRRRRQAALLRQPGIQHRHRQLREPPVSRRGPSSLAGGRHLRRAQPEPHPRRDSRAAGRSPRTAAILRRRSPRRWMPSARAATWTPTPRGRSTSSPRPRPATRSTSAASQTRRPRPLRQSRTTSTSMSAPKADSPWEGDKFLLARRLVEAGVPVVTLRAGGWDHHGNVVSGAGRHHLHQPAFGVAAARSLDSRPGDRPARSRPGQGSAGAGLGRVRPHAEDFAERPRSLAGCQLRPVRRRREDRPGHRRDRQPRRTARRSSRSARRMSSARFITTLGIDWKQKVNDFSGRPTQLLDDGEAIEELVV